MADNMTLSEDDLLIEFIPRNAGLIVEIDGKSDAIAQKYKKYNPSVRYINIKDSTVAEPVDADCLIYNNSLEKLGEVQTELIRHAAWLKEEGQVVASIYNYQYWQRIIELLTGRREKQYEQMQFFTIDDIIRMFAAAGFQVFDIKREVEAGKDFQRLQPFLRPLIGELGLDPERTESLLTGKRYIVRAIKSARPARQLLVQTMLVSKIASDTIRVYEPDSFIRTIPGVRTVSSVGQAELSDDQPGNEKVFIWQRQILRYPADLEKQRQLIRRGYLIVAEIDDDPLFWPEYAANNFITFRSAHCVQTSTEYLADILREFNPNVAVFPNQLAVLPPPRTYENSAVTIFFGAFNREKDWQAIMPILNEVLPEYGDKVRVQVVYDRLFYDALQVQSKSFEPLCTYSRYQQIMRNADIALLPLSDTRFNHCKSDLKFIQCAGHGVAVLASPTVYATSVIHGKTGLIYHDLEEFKASLRELIEDAAYRQSIARNAYCWVKQNRLLAQHYHERYNWYLTMRDRLPDLNEQLRKRVPEVFEKGE